MGKLVSNHSPVAEVMSGHHHASGILSAVNFAASVFLQSSSWPAAIDVALERLGKSAKVNRAYLFENETREGDGAVLTSQRAEWVAPGTEPQINNPDLQKFPLVEMGLGRWLATMNQRQPVFGLISTFPEGEREVFQEQGIQSIVVMPVFAKNHLWGFLGFDDCERTRIWSPAELNALSAAATTLGAAIDRQDLESQLRFAQKMEAIGSLAAGIAHDFNNMLQVICSFTSIAKAKIPEGQSAQSDLDQVLDSADRAHGLTRQLLSFAREQRSDPADVSLSGICETVIAMLKPSLRSGIELTTELAFPSPIIFADEGLMSQMLLNLCFNARDAMPSGGQLKLTSQKRRVTEADRNHCPVDRAGDYAVLTVADTGHGIRPEIIDRIFEPFFSTKERLGTGLGLSVAFGTIQQCGGFVDVASELGQGTTFRVFIPLAEGKEPKELLPVERPRAKGVILLVDDEPLVLESLGLLIESYGYSVRKADGGDRAMEYINDPSEVIDLVLSDQVMPGTDGISLLQSILVVRPKTKAILMSGYAPNLEELARFHSDVPLIQKPIRNEDLRREIQNLLAK